MADNRGAGSGPSHLDTLRQRYEHILLEFWQDNTDGSHDIAHIRRVWQNALAIIDGEGKPVDMAVLLPAVIFHDLINLPKDDPERHRASARSADQALIFLQETDLTDNQRDNITHTITAHSFSANIRAETIEAQILQDADRLDALGAIGIARAMYVAGRLDRILYHPEDPEAKDRPLDDSQFTLDHFPIKLFRLAEQMNTATARQLADSRTDYMRAFCNRLLDEATSARAISAAPSANSD